MKTFFNITIKGIGEPLTIKVQSTKLRKFDQSSKYGFYRLSKKIEAGFYHVSVVLALTYSVELGGTIEKHFKQKRYAIHQVHHEVYVLDRYGMYHCQPQSLCSVSVEIEEQDVQPCSCTISTDNR